MQGAKFYPCSVGALFLDGSWCFAIPVVLPMLVGIGALPQSLFVPKNYTISVAAAIPLSHVPPPRRPRPRERLFPRFRAVNRL